MSTIPMPTLRRALVATLAAVALAGGAVPVLAAPGDIDDSFGEGGWAVVSFSDAFDEGNAAVAVGSDRKPVIVGNADRDMTVARFLSDGSLDPAFSGDGRQIVHTDGLDLAHAVALQGRKVLLGGESDARGVVARLRASGERDRTFSRDGLAVIGGLSGYDEIVFETVSDGGDGRVIAAGSILHSATGRLRAIIVRFTADGRRDRTFSGDGVRIVNWTANTVASDVAIDRRGRLLVALASSRADGVLRLLPDGRHDRSFGGGDGLAEIDDSGLDLYGLLSLARSGGRIVVAGNVSGDPGVRGFVARFEADGSQSATFGRDGLVELDYQPTDIAVLSDRSIVVLIPEYIFHLLANGAPDPAWNGGTGGTDLSAATTVRATTVDSLGRILVSGEVYPDQFVVGIRSQ